PEKMGLYLGKVQKRPKCDTRRVHGGSFLRKELESPRKGPPGGRDAVAGGGGSARVRGRRPGGPAALAALRPAVGVSWVPSPRRARRRWRSAGRRRGRQTLPLRTVPAR